MNPTPSIFQVVGEEETVVGSAEQVGPLYPPNPSPLPSAPYPPTPSPLTPSPSTPAP